MAARSLSVEARAFVVEWSAVGARGGVTLREVRETVGW